MELRIGKPILFVGLFSIVLALIIIFALLFTTKDIEFGVYIIVTVLFLIFFGIGMYLTLHYVNYRIEIDEKSMIIQNELGRKKEIFWNNIDQVTFNKSFKMIVISSNKKKTWVSPIYSQIFNFIPKDTYSEKLKKIIQ